MGLIYFIKDGFGKDKGQCQRKRREKKEKRATETEMKEQREMKLKRNRTVNEIYRGRISQNDCYLTMPTIKARIILATGI